MTLLDTLSDVLGEFCLTNNLPFISADDILYGDSRDKLTEYQTKWLENYITIWDHIAEVQ